MKRIKKFLKMIFVGAAIGFSSFALTGCSSTEKQATSYSFSVVSCAYNSESDSTKIVWFSQLVNDSIYDIKNESFKFDLYDGETFVRTTDYVTYEIAIKHGSSNSGNRNFTANGKVTDVKINSWVASFSNVWETYLPWFISVIVIAPVLAVIYIILMIINDLEFDDLIEFLEDHLWFIPFLAIPFVPYLISSLSSGVWSWVPPIIIGGGIIAAIIIILIAHLIKFFIDEASFSATSKVKIKKHYDSKGNPFLEIEGEKKRYYIKDLLDDRDGLMYFSKKDLRNYCEKQKWFDAQNLFSKEKLAIFIMDNSSSKEDEAEEENGTNEKKKTIKSKKYSKTRFDDIAGLDEVKKAFKEKVIMPFEHPELFEKFGKKAGGGILLYGLPGTGKTMFAEAAANEIDALFIPIKCSDVKSKWYGESEKKVKEIFAKARKADKAIIFFDEFEAIGAKRTDSENGNNDLVPQILAEMQGVGSSTNKSVIIVIAATNKPWAIDSAFMRPGRFDEKIYVPLPDFDARKKLFEIQLSKLPVSNDLDFDYLAKITEGFNGADIKEVCEKLKMSAINDSLEKGEQQTIGMDDIQRIEGSIRSSVSIEDIEMLAEFEKGLR